jgi:hypothetical protein
MKKAGAGRAFEVLLFARNRRLSPEIQRVRAEQHVAWLKELREDPIVAARRPRRDCDRGWLWFVGMFLNRVFPKAFAVVPTILVTLQAAQHHPDAPPAGCVPARLPYEGMQNLYRFVLRALSDAAGQAWRETKGARGKLPLEAYAEDAYARTDIVWGARLSERLRIAEGQAAFWNKHANTWWAKDDVVRAMVRDHPMTAEQRASSAYPDRYVATYEVLIHPAWFPRVPRGAFDSR